MTFDASTSQGLYLVRIIEVCMDASGDQSGEQQAAEKPIGIEEQKTIERQEAEAEEEVSTEDVNDLPATTTENKHRSGNKVRMIQNKMLFRNQNQNPVIRLQNYSISLPNTFRIAK